MQFMADALKRCGGRLSLSEVTFGMNAAIKNAERLLSDSGLLLENKRYPSAASLAILAIEEAGKVSILRQILTASDDEIKQCWRDYRSHKSKNAMWILPDLVHRGARTLKGFRDAANPQGEHTALIDAVKQIAFYTDFLGVRNWSEPQEVVSQELASGIYAIAKVLCANREVREEENRLWVKHLGRDSIHGMTREGLSDYFREGCALGLIDSNEEEANRFIFGAFHSGREEQGRD